MTVPGDWERIYSSRSGAPLASRSFARPILPPDFQSTEMFHRERYPRSLFHLPAPNPRNGRLNHGGRVIGGQAATRPLHHSTVLTNNRKDACFQLSGIPACRVRRVSAVQEAFVRTRLLEGALPEMIRRQAGEAGLTVLGRNERLAYDSAENAIQLCNRLV